MTRCSRSKSETGPSSSRGSRHRGWPYGGVGRRSDHRGDGGTNPRPPHPFGGRGSSAEVRGRARAASRSGASKGACLASQGQAPARSGHREPAWGEPRRQHVLMALKNLLRRFGLRMRSFHSLRHYFCSKLVSCGASIEAVRLLAGHSDPCITQRYAHAQGKELKAAIAKLSGQ